MAIKGLSLVFTIGKLRLIDATISQVIESDVIKRNQARKIASDKKSLSLSHSLALSAEVDE